MVFRIGRLRKCGIATRISSPLLRTLRGSHTRGAHSVAAPETTVELVQTRERETEIIGQPDKIINLGAEPSMYTRTRK